MEDKIKILYILTKSDLGGVQKYLLEIITHLSENIEPYFVMSSPGYFSEELEKLGFKKNIFFVQMTNSIVNLPLHIKSNLQTLNIIRKINPDLIHCNSMTGGIVGRVCGFLTNTQVIFTAHGWTFSGGYSKPKLTFYKILEIFLGLLTKKIICVSQYDMEIALKIMSFFKNKLITIHNGISDINDNLIKKRFLASELKIIMVTRFSWPKRPDILIETVADLCNENYNLSLDLYGYGNNLDHTKKIITNTKCEKIKYCGILTNPEKILAQYDIYALISDKEGLPIGIIEALRAGLPVIASDVGGCAEEIIDGENGFLIQTNNKEQLKEKLKFLYKNKYLLPEFSKKSRQLYETEFTADKMCKRTFNLYKDVLKENV